MMQGDRCNSMCALAACMSHPLSLSLPLELNVYQNKLHIFSFILSCVMNALAVFMAAVTWSTVDVYLSCAAGAFLFRRETRSPPPLNCNCKSRALHSYTSLVFACVEYCLSCVNECFSGCDSVTRSHFARPSSREKGGTGNSDTDESKRQRERKRSDCIHRIVELSLMFHEYWTSARGKWWSSSRSWDSVSWIHWYQRWLFSLPGFLSSLFSFLCSLLSSPSLSCLLVRARVTLWSSLLLRLERQCYVAIARGKTRTLRSNFMSWVEMRMETSKWSSWCDLCNELDEATSEHRAHWVDFFFFLFYPLLLGLLYFLACSMQRSGNRHLSLFAQKNTNLHDREVTEIFCVSICYS